MTLKENAVESVTSSSTNLNVNAGDKSVLQKLLTSFSKYQSLLIGFLLFIIALGFDLYRLGTPGIWFDEAFSVELARLPLPLLLHLIFGPEPNMELYYLFLHFWLQLTSFFGLHQTEFIVRLPSAFFAALSTFVVFALGKRFLSTAAGIAGSGLYLLNYLQLVYAQQTRSYSLQLLLICLAWYALLVALSEKATHRRWWVCFVITTVLAVYAHLFSVVILFSQLVAVVAVLIIPNPWSVQARQQLLSLIASVASIAVLVLPMIILSRQGSKTGWLPIPHLKDVYHLFLTITSNSKIFLAIIVLLCTLGCGVAVAFVIPVLREKLSYAPNMLKFEYRDKWFPVAIALVCWLVLPIAVSYIVSQGSTRLFSSRYLVTIVPPLCLLVGLGIAALRWRTVQTVMICALLLVALRYVHIYYDSAQVEDWNSTVHWLEQQYRSGDGLVCYTNVQGCQISVEYYLHAYPTGAHFTDDSPGAYSWTKYGPVDPKGGYEAAVSPAALAIYSARHPRIFFIVGRIPDDNAKAHALAAQKWLDSHYRYSGQIVTPSVTVRLYVADNTK